MAMKKNGFTMTEAMVTMAIIGIIAALGIPNLFSIMPNLRLNAATRSVIENIMYAKSKCINKKLPYMIFFTPTTYWIVEDTNFDSYPNINEIVLKIDINEDYPGIMIGSFYTNRLYLDPRGTISARTIPIFNRTRKKNIVINIAGHIRVE